MQIGVRASLEADGKMRWKMSLKHITDIQVEFLKVINRLMLGRDIRVGNLKNLSILIVSSVQAIPQGDPRRRVSQIQ